MVRLLSLPLFVSAAASFIMALFFIAYYLRARRLFNERPLPYKLYAAASSSIGVFLLCFGVTISAGASLTLLNFSARLAVIATTVTLILLIGFYSEYFREPHRLPLRPVRIANALFILLAMFNTPLFLQKAPDAVSRHYTGLRHGPLFLLWGLYILLLTLYAILLLLRIYLRVRRHDRVDKAAALALIVANMAFLACGAADLLTAVKIVDWIPLTWIGALLVVAAIAWVLFVRLDALFRDKNRLYEMVIHDHQTGVYTRGFFETRLEETLRTLPRQPRDIYIAKLDVDEFKAINDRFGHGNGDKVLRTITAIARRHLRPGDIFARLGGDEFAFIIERVHDQQHLLAIVQRLRDAIGGHIFREGEATFSITCSFGVAGYGGEPTAIDPVCDRIMEKADEALRSSKRSGRNSITLAFIEG
jgi:diguanylate cyclase (GGDEF)-like protein